MMRALRCMAVSLLLCSCATDTWNRLPIPSNSQDAQNKSIAKIMDDVHQGIEARNIYKVLSHVAPEYADETGRTQDSAREALKNFFSQWRSLKLTRTNPRLQVNDGEAIALESIGLIAEPFKVDGSSLNWFGDLRVWLRRGDDGEWRITRVSPGGQGT